MPVYQNIPICPGEDGLVTVQMAPPVAIGGWAIQFTVTRNYGSNSGIILGYAASGFNGVSGITVTNSGAGIMSVRIPGILTSGLNQGSYPTSLTRTTSGFVTLLDYGFLLLK